MILPSGPATCHGMVFCVWKHYLWDGFTPLRTHTHTTARTSTRTQTQKLPNTNLVYCDNFACLLNSEIVHYEVCFKSRYNLISRAWAKSSVLWSCIQTLVIENTATWYRHNKETQLDQVSSWTCMLSDLHLRSHSRAEEPSHTRETFVGIGFS